MLGCLGEVADGLRGRVGWGRDRLRGSLRAIQPYYYYSYCGGQVGATGPQTDGRNSVSRFYIPVVRSTCIYSYGEASRPVPYLFPDEALAMYRGQACTTSCTEAVARFG